MELTKQEIAQEDHIAALAAKAYPNWYTEYDEGRAYRGFINGYKTAQRQEIATQPVTHETFLIGFNEADEVIFFKSYEYLKDKETAQADAKWVTENCHHWEFGAADQFVLVHEDSAHGIVIPHP